MSAPFRSVYRFFYTLPLWRQMYNGEDGEKSVIYVFVVAENGKEAEALFNAHMEETPHSRKSWHFEQVLPLKGEPKQIIYEMPKLKYERLRGRKN